MDIKQRARERRIAEEIAHELHRVLGPIMPEALAVKSDRVCGIFSEFDRHHVVSEASGARILAFVPKYLARLNLKYAEFNRQLDGATRQGGTFSPPNPGITHIAQQRKSSAYRAMTVAGL